MAKDAHRDGGELEVNVGVVVVAIGDAGDRGDERGASTERTGAEAGAHAEPDVAPVGDAIGLLELPGGELRRHRAAPRAVRTVMRSCLSGPGPSHGPS